MPTTEQAPEPERDERPSDAPALITPPKASIFAVIGIFLVILTVALTLLVVTSAGVVYVTAIAAHRLGLPELHVLLALLALAALVVVAYLGSRIAGEIAATQRSIDAAAREIGREIEASKEDVAAAIDELPAVVIPHELAPTAGRPKRARPWRRCRRRARSRATKDLKRLDDGGGEPVRRRFVSGLMQAAGQPEVERIRNLRRAPGQAGSQA